MSPGLNGGRSAAGNRKSLAVSFSSVWTRWISRQKRFCPKMGDGLIRHGSSSHSFTAISDNLLPGVLRHPCTSLDAYARAHSKPGSTGVMAVHGAAAGSCPQGWCFRRAAWGPMRRGVRLGGRSPCLSSPTASTTCCVVASPPTAASSILIRPEHYGDGLRLEGFYPGSTFFHFGMEFPAMA